VSAVQEAAEVRRLQDALSAAQRASGSRGVRPLEGREHAGVRPLEGRGHEGERQGSNVRLRCVRVVGNVTQLEIKVKQLWNKAPVFSEINAATTNNSFMTEALSAQKEAALNVMFE